MRTLFFSEIEKSQTMKLLINVKIKINKKSLKHCIWFLQSHKNNRTIAIFGFCESQKKYLVFLLDDILYILRLVEYA